MVSLCFLGRLERMCIYIFLCNLQVRVVPFRDGDNLVCFDYDDGFFYNILCGQ